jgi:hypothetical protein
MWTRLLFRPIVSNKEPEIIPVSKPEGTTSSHIRRLFRRRKCLLPWSSQFSPAEKESPAPLSPKKEVSTTRPAPS